MSCPPAGPSRHPTTARPGREAAREACQDAAIATDRYAEQNVNALEEIIADQRGPLIRHLAIAVPAGTSVDRSGEVPPDQ